MTIISFIMLVPWVALTIVSIVPYTELLEGWWNIKNFKATLANFVTAWYHPSYPLERGFINSFIVAFFGAILQIFIASLAAYSLVMTKLIKLRNLILGLLTILLVFPLQSLIGPYFHLIALFNLQDTFTAVILTHIAYGLPWVSLFMFSYFSSLPREIEESAKVDGAPEWQIFWRIFIPLSIPALVSVFCLQFMWMWNDYFVALVFIQSPEKLVAVQRVTMLRGEYWVDYGLLAAGSILVTLPPLILFIFFQKYFIKGYVGWIVKG